MDCLRSVWIVHTSSLVAAPLPLFQVFWTTETLRKEPVIFGDFLDPSIPPDSRIYKHIQDNKRVLAVLEDCHKKYAGINAQVR